MSDLGTLVKLRAHGIVIPRIALGVSRLEHFPLPVLCAVLEQESNGGHNVYGHDPTIYIGYGRVTKKNYAGYLALRKATGKFQGVGPMQLTWYSYQDDADAIGGCWNPTPNVTVGCRVLDGHGVHVGCSDAQLWSALKNYNGSAIYANEVMNRYAHWRTILR